MLLPNKPLNILTVLGALIVFGSAYFFWSLGAPHYPALAEEKSFEIVSGEGLFDISQKLDEAGIVKSAWAFAAYAAITGSADVLKPGHYLLSTASSARVIVAALVAGSNQEVEVVIKEGASVYEIDETLSGANVIRPGAMIDYVLASAEPLEGRLFPDRYRFFKNTAAEVVAKKMLETFKNKAEPILLRDKTRASENLIIASLLEREVPDFRDRRIVAGLLKKRIQAGMPIQVDATVCYAKEVRDRADGKCWPITAADLKIDSPYNTYLNKGWPPGPIGNPGVAAIEAALSPESSPYWFYLSDPATKKTIFSETLDEHARNRAKYLR